MTLKDGKERRIDLKDWSSVNAIDWTADGKSLWVSASTTTGTNALLNVDLQGRARPLWEQTKMARGLGDSFARWTLSGDVASQRQRQCLDGGELLTIEQCHGRAARLQRRVLEAE